MMDEERKRLILRTLQVLARNIDTAAAQGHSAAMKGNPINEALVKIDDFALQIREIVSDVKAED